MVTKSVATSIGTSALPRGKFPPVVASIEPDTDADVLTVYDPHGTYGHPDHLQVHIPPIGQPGVRGSR